MFKVNIVNWLKNNFKKFSFYHIKLVKGFLKLKDEVFLIRIYDLINYIPSTLM